MLISPNLNIYLKTTETCNLNCSHCFTSGSKGSKIFFSPDKVVGFFERLAKDCPWVSSVKFNFHGGEPMLAPIKDLYKAYEGLEGLFKETFFSMQTNLVYRLSQERRDFMKNVLGEGGFGSSWDYDIRFGSTSPGSENARVKQMDLWEKNVRTLIKEDSHYMTMIVSITKKLIEEKEPIEIISYAKELGFQNILFERITSDGNAKTSNEVIPSNREQDEWLYKMFQQSFEYKTYEHIGNMLMSELAEAYVFHKHTANRCRTCEKSLLTINADGTIAGCPNSAPTSFWGHTDWSIEKNLQSEGRLKAISCEAFNRKKTCYECPAFEYCNSDCQKLGWDEKDTYCPAPKKIWEHMIKENDVDKYKKLIIGASKL